MKCKSASVLIKAWLDGELEPTRAARVERHVAECPGCRAVAADFGEISLAVRSFAAGPVPALDVGRVLARSRHFERESARLVMALRRIAAAAAIVLVASGVGAVGQWLYEEPSSFNGASLPGTTGTPACLAMTRAWALSPISRMASGEGPMNVRPQARQMSAKDGFSARKP